MPIPELGNHQSPIPYKEKSATSPLFTYGYVHVEHDEEFILECAATQTILLKKNAIKANKIVVKCIKNKSFTYEGQPYQYQDIKCEGPVVNEKTMTKTSPTTEDPYKTAVARNNAGH